MVSKINNSTELSSSRKLSWWQNWPVWVGYVTALWSLVFAGLGVYWMFGQPGFPFGRSNDPGAIGSVFYAASAQTVAPWIAMLGFVGLIVAVVMARAKVRGWLGVSLVTFAWVAFAVLVLVISDYRILMAIAYVPLCLIGAPFHWPNHLSYFDVVQWPVIFQVICLIGGVLWAGTAVAFRRRMQGGCIYCGRKAGENGWTTPAAAARWGKWATYIAVAIPIMYAITRYSWFLGIPLGITEEFLREGQATNLWLAGAGLATVAVAGAIVTLGLIQRWGEVFPGWMIGLRGKRVPMWLAVVPAVLVAAIVTSAGLSFIRMFLNIGGAEQALSAITAEAQWAAIMPELLWPFWGIALFAAALAYYFRRRGPCKACGR